MKKITGDLWETSAQVKVIPTNGVTTRIDQHVHRAVMGAGVARQAAERYPSLPLLLGARLHRGGNHVYVFQVPPVFRDKIWCTVLATFPTKAHWRDPSMLSLISHSAQELRHAADQNGWESIVLPPVGCGLGGLDWGAVEPVLDRYLDARFTVIDNKEPS